MKRFIENNFWNKLILPKGQHDVEITSVEKGKNVSTGSPFIICVFENEHGYFPQKINVMASSERNYNYIKALYECAGLETPENMDVDYTQLLEKKVSIFIGMKANMFGKNKLIGLSINKFYKQKDI